MIIRLYMPLGYNRNNQVIKHYRHYINRELERTDYIDERTFSEVPIYRGSRIIDDSFMQKLFGKRESDYRVMNTNQSLIMMFIRLLATSKQ